ncbi:MAG: YdcF family protein [Chloroflexota bacterium]
MNNYLKHLYPNRQQRQALLLTLLILISLGGGIYLFRTQIMTSLARFLIIDDPLQPSDLIFVLNGGLSTRPAHATELYHQGVATKIAISDVEIYPQVALQLSPHETDVAVELMQKLDVPAEDIIVLTFPGGVTSTRDEAELLRDYVTKTEGIRRVTVVTSAFHTRRSHWIFQRALAETDVTLQMKAAPQWRFDETDWWRSERGLLMFANEYIKLGYYLLRY